MGFTSVHYLDENYITAANSCEEVWISMGFEYDLQIFWNLSWSFMSPCLGYSWNKTNCQYARAGYYDNAQKIFYNLLRNTYQYQKPAFNSYYTLKMKIKQLVGQNVK